MKKFILIPDSFKGTMSSAEICTIVGEEIRRKFHDAEIISIPVADGGEGTVDAFLTAVGGERIEVACTGPYMEDVTAFYGLLPDGTAVIEMAAAGLPMAGECRHAEQTTTYGVGQLIAHAAHHGAKSIVLGLGGSATNDGGCGCAAALGVRFLNESGKPYIPVGGTLDKLSAVDISGLDPAVAALPFTTMCDIDNPLCGPNGASAVFGPQKGADPETVAMLDANLLHLAEVVRRDVSRDVLAIPGGGAAGGFGAGSVAFFGSQLRMGIETVLDLTGFDALVTDADLVITGEGKLDSQSLRGKVVVGVARRAKRAGVPVAALVGASEAEIEGAYAEGISGVFPINPAPDTFDEVKGKCCENLRFTTRNLLHFIAALERSVGGNRAVPVNKSGNKALPQPKKQI